ncbi:MAG: exonuclease SbcCD subunit D [Candidatus Promineifilaceae bacterium]|nr:exonuclease SbcCD subunit D [Candidatus Promineifilaceae bacterium]
MSEDQRLRVLHFADAHIDIANYGRHDPHSGLPIRVVDFLSALDQIIDAAIDQAVDLVIFAGDAYKDRNPQPTFQRAWGQRMMRLSAAGIPTLLLVGNHDKAPAEGRANTIQEFATLDVPHIMVADELSILGPDRHELPVQLITVPWLSRSSLMTREETSGLSHEQVLELIEQRLADGLKRVIDRADPELPLILVAHASVQGARYGSERAVMLGHELVLSGNIVNDSRLDYVALGHIHKHQSLNGDRHPPVVYPGSIERIDFGEAREKKGYVLADVSRGQTSWRFVPLKTRRFVDLEAETTDANTFMEDILSQLPGPEEVTGAICRLKLRYPRDWEPLLDEAAISERFAEALSFHIQKQHTISNRARLGDTVAVETLGPVELLDQYWETIDLDPDEAAAMRKLSQEVLGESELDSGQD